MPTLTFPETRILGVLLEKEAVTPENYPLSLNSLVNACNQATNREPVTALEEKAVQAGVEGLREKGLATVVFGAGSRVQKYRHNLPDHYTLSPRETALLCCLLLRGPQTPGELRQRTERLAPFAGLPEVEATLEALCAGADPLVAAIPAGPGRKEKRYTHRLGPEPTAATVATATIAAAPTATTAAAAMATAAPASFAPEAPPRAAPCGVCAASQPRWNAPLRRTGRAESRAGKRAGGGAGGIAGAQRGLRRVSRAV